MRLYTTHEAGERLGVTRVTVWRYVKAGRLRAINLNLDPTAKPKYRISADELQEFIDSQTLPLSA